MAALDYAARYRDASGKRRHRGRPGLHLNEIIVDGPEQKAGRSSRLGSPREFSGNISATRVSYLLWPAGEAGEGGGGRGRFPRNPPEKPLASVCLVHTSEKSLRTRPGQRRGSNGPHFTWYVFWGTYRKRYVMSPEFWPAEAVWDVPFPRFSGLVSPCVERMVQL